MASKIPLETQDSRAPSKSDLPGDARPWTWRALIGGLGRSPRHHQDEGPPIHSRALDGNRPSGQHSEDHRHPHAGRTARIL